MARLFDAASLEHLGIDSTPITGTPLAMSCWFNRSSIAAVGMTLVWVGDKGASRTAWWLEIQGFGAGNRLEFYSALQAGQAITTTTTVAANTGQWYHACGIEASATDRRVLLDNGGKGTNSTSVIPIGIDRINIARRGDSSPSEYFGGSIAESAIWDLSDWPGVTASDKADSFEAIALPALAQGYSPMFFPLGLVAYWPLIRDEDQDRVGGYDLTAFNIPSIAAHPPVIYPAAQFVGKGTSAGGSNYFRILIDPIGATDTLSLILNYRRSVDDITAITDEVITTREIIKNLADSISITDTLTTARELILSISETVGITDSISTIVGIIVAIADAVGITSIISTVRNIIVNIADGIGVTDLISKIGTFFIRPDGDQSIGQWTDELGGTTNIYQSIDEPAPPIDSDYIQSPFAPQTQSYICTLSDALDPGLDTGHTLSYRYRKFPVTNQQVDLTAVFLQGAVELTSWTHVNVSSGWITANQLIPSGIVANITDYTDLRLELEADIV